MMELFYSPNSPYARKCRAVALEKGLEAQLTLTAVDTAAPSPEFLSANPLGKIPTLKTASGELYCESPVICEYLDSLSPSPPLFPAAPELRLLALALAALADGVMDAAVEIVLQYRRDEAKRLPDLIEKRQKSIIRTLAVMEHHPALKLTRENEWHIGLIAAAVAAEYVNFRLPQVNWKHDAPLLSEWLESVAERPSLKATRPG